MKKESQQFENPIVREKTFENHFVLLKNRNGNWFIMASSEFCLLALEYPAYDIIITQYFVFLIIADMFRNSNWNSFNVVEIV